MDIAANNNENNCLKQYVLERKWVLAFAFSVMVVTTLPYFLGYWVENHDLQHAWRFTGFIFGVEDGNSYIAKALTGMAGAWLFRTPYTVIPQKGVVAFLPYLVYGKLVSAPGTHEQLVVLFHAFRFFAGVLMIFATFDFIKYFIVDERASKFGLVMAVLSGGVGWILVFLGKSTLLGSLPLEFYSPEAFGFLSLYGVPHLAMARAFLLWGILWHFKLSSDIKAIEYRKFLMIGLIWLSVALLQPLTALIMGMVLGLHFIIVIGHNINSMKPLCVKNKEEVLVRIKIFLLELVPILPFFVYYVIAYSTDGFLKAWSAQNIISSPNPIHYLLAYCSLLPFALAGIYTSVRQKEIEKIVLIGWLIISMILAYSPTTIQRRLIEGIWVVLVVLMLAGYKWIQTDHPEIKLGWYLPMVTMLALPSTLILLAGGVMTALNPAEPIFHPTAEVGSFEFLNGYAQTEDIVMASYETGNVLPAYAPVRVLAGHGPESADHVYFKSLVDHFYSSTMDDTERQAIIDKYRIRFIYCGPHEHRLGNWDPVQAVWLTQVFNYDGYAVYEIIK